MLHKSFDILETKADGESGTFEALVSVFNNVDSVGDRIMPGAYEKTLADWQSSGDPIPIILSHQWNDAMAHIGVADPKDVVETDKGLWVKGHLDIADNPVAKQVHKLLKRRSLKEFSIGYRVPEGGEKRAKDGANEIAEIDLVEAGPTLKGANAETELHAVKTALEVEEPPTAEALLASVRAAVEVAQEQHELFKDAEVDLTREVQEMLGVKPDETDKEPLGARSVDPLRKRSLETVLEIQSDGLSRRKSPTTKPEPKPEPPPEAELKRRSRDLMLELLTGVSE